MSKPIAERVDDVFGALDDTQRDSANSYLMQLHSNMSEAERSATRRLLLFAILWAAMYLIAIGTVEEGQFGPFKLKELKGLLPAVPPIMAGLAYGLMISYLARNNVRHAISRVYKHILPKLYEHDLEYLAMPPSYRNVEALAELQDSGKLASWFRSAWGVLEVFLVTGGTFVALSHAVYIVITVTEASWLTLALSIGIAFVFWLRGIAVIATSPEQK